jgi:hypothetical protein
VNLFFVHNSEIGSALPNTFSSLTPKLGQADWANLHYFCYYTAWQQVPATAPFSSPNLMELLQPVILGHSPDSKSKRVFHEAVLPVALKVQPGCMETDVDATLKVAAAAKMWAGASGPQVPEEQQPSGSFYACPNRSHKEGRGGEGSSSSSSSSSSSAGGSGDRSSAGGRASAFGGSWDNSADSSQRNGVQHVTKRQMIGHGHHTKRHAGGHG